LHQLNSVGRQLGTTPIDALAFSHDARTLAVGVGREVRLWHVPTGRELLTFQPLSQQSIRSLRFLPDGRLMACGDADSLGVQAAIWSAGEE
jgi:WD40 repeat protein